MNYKYPKWLKPVVITVIIICIVIYLLLNQLPQVMKELGLSNVMSYKNYKTMVEFQIKDGPDFALVVDKKNKLLTILCLNEESIELSRLKLDNKNYKYSINKILTELYMNNSINDINIIEYDNYKIINNVEDITKEQLLSYKLDNKVTKTKGSLKKRAKDFDINDKTTKNILIKFSLYSSNLISKGRKEEPVEEKFDVKKHTDVIYNKLEKYKNSNNIINQDKENPTIKIDQIPSKNNLFADSDSWYYIKDGHTYAYIKFSKDNNIYSICYMGDKNNYKEGSCQ